MSKPKAAKSKRALPQDDEAAFAKEAARRLLDHREKRAKYMKAYRAKKSRKAKIES